MFIFKIKGNQTHYEAALEIFSNRIEMSTNGSLIKTDDRIEITSGTLYAPKTAQIKEIIAELNYMFYEDFTGRKPLSMSRVLPQ